MVSPSIREVQDKQEMQRFVGDFLIEGYTIKEQSTDTTLMKKKTWGSQAYIILSIVAMIIIGVLSRLTGFLVSWLIPVLYVIYAHYTAPEVFLRIAPPQAPPQGPPQGPPQV